MRILIVRFYYKNNIALGNVLSDVLRNESYMACFTYNDASNHHLGNYGDVCFTFKTDTHPFQNLKNFKLKAGQVLSLNTNEFKEMGNTANKIDNFITSSQKIKVPNKIDELYHIMLKRNLTRAEYKSNTIKIIKAFERFNSQSNTTSMISNFAKLSSHLITDPVENKEVITYLDSRTRFLRNERIAEFLEDSNLKKYYSGINNPLPYNTNIISCFIKDSEFSSDDEFRVIALPTNSTKVVGRFIEVPLDLNTIHSIRLKENMPNREENIQKLKSCLTELNLNSIEIY